MPRSSVEALHAQRLSLLKELDQNANDNGFLLKIATVCMELKLDDEAIEYLERLDSLGYRDEPLIYSSLGKLYRDKKEYQEALSSYRKYLEFLDPKHPHYIRTMDILSELEFIEKELSKSEQIVFEPVEDVNSSDQEYLPQFTLDGSSIIFTRRWYGQEDLMHASKNDSGYQIRIIDELSTMNNEGAHTISADGQKIIFTKCKDKSGYGSCDLYESTMTESGWSAPKNLGSRINSVAWESQPSLSSDGKTLYFASNRKGTMGGSDIWFSTRLPDGTWSNPINAGKEINTSFNDESPFIHADNKTLFFRSDRKPGLGNFDIYFARRDSLGELQIVNLGFPINSTENDGALVVGLDGKSAYYATDYLAGKHLGSLDIVHFELPERFCAEPMTYLKGRVTQAETGIPLQAELMLFDLKAKTTLTKLQCNFNGEFLVAVPLHREISVHIAQDGFMFFSAHLFVDNLHTGSNPKELKIELYPVKEMVKAEEPVPTVLQNIFFASGSAELLTESETELNYLLHLLEKNKEIRIRIIGYTDNVGNSRDNLILSERRANSVRSRLIELGVRASRIEATGKGEEQAIADNNTEQGRKENRRTEFIIIR